MANLEVIYEKIDLWGYTNESLVFLKKEIHKLQTSYSNTEIIEAQKYIINKYSKTNYSYLYSVKKAILASLSMSDNFDIIFDEELINLYKKYIIISIFHFLLPKMNEESKEVLRFDNNSILGNEVNYYISETNKSLAEKEDYVSYLIENNKEKLDKLFEIMFNGDVDNILEVVKTKDSKPISTSEITNKFTNILIENWKEFGIKFLNSEMQI